MANIDEIFGPMSASHKLYQQIFNLYNNTPGASAATPGNFNDSLGCNGWQGPDGLGTTEACAVHFYENLYHPASESIASGRVDWNIGVNDRVFLLVQYDHGTRAAHVDPINSVFNAYTQQPWWQGQLNETHTIGSSASKPVSASGDLHQPDFECREFGTNPGYLSNDVELVYAGNPFSVLGGWDAVFALPTGFKTTSYQISDDMLKTRGKHKFGFGVSFLRTYWTGGGYNEDGTGHLLPQTVNAFFYGGVNPSSPETDFTILNQTYPAVTWNRFAFYNLGLYGQDEWHARR